MSQDRIPPWVKLGMTLLAAVTFPAYWAYYGFGPAFLWFSSVALLVTCVALWLESRFLASMQAVGVVVLEFIYIADLFYRLATGAFLTGLSVHLFDAQAAPVWVRSLSLFHVPLPFLLLWLLSRLGYDRRGWRAQTALAWVLLPVSYAFTDPEDNVNWVFGPEDHAWEWMPEWGWMVLLMALFPLLIYLPSHAVFRRIFRPSDGRREDPRDERTG